MKIPFNKAELEHKGFTPGAGRMRGVLLNTPITPRENFLRFLRNEEPLWMPLSCDTISLTPAIVADNKARGFLHDSTDFDPVRDGGGADMFGIEWEYVPEANGSMIRPGNHKVEDINDWEDIITFPDIDSWDWEASAESNRAFIEQQDQLFGVTILNGLFERLISFCGMGDALTNLIDEDAQDAVHRLFDKLADFYGDLIRKFKTYYHIDYVTFHDDWGSQRSSFFSLDTAMEMLVPYLKRIVDAAHDADVFFELHSCGKNERLVPAMIAAGVDMWNGQPMNDKKLLCEQYGDQLHLGVSPEIPFTATDEEIRAIYTEFFGTYKDYPIYGGLFFGSERAKEIAYEFARTAKCGADA